MIANGKIKVLLVAGARPNFMKIAPVYREALRHHQVDCRIAHTGQHYDYEMSQTFFEDLDLPEPAFFLEAGSGSHAVQTGKIMVAFEELCETEKPDLVMVVGKKQRTEVGGQRTEVGTGASQLRSKHAGRDQPDGDGCFIRLFFCDGRKRHSESSE